MPTANDEVSSSPSSEPLQDDLPNPKEELEALLHKKRVLEENLASLERQIYNFEGSYLEETQAHGNVVIGFDGYFLNRAQPVIPKRQKLKESNRIFSLSSSTYLRSLGIRDRNEDGDIYHTPGKSDTPIKKKKKHAQTSLSYYESPQTPSTDVKKLRLKFRDSDDDLDI